MTDSVHNRHEYLRDLLNRDQDSNESFAIVRRVLGNNCADEDCWTVLNCVWIAIGNESFESREGMLRTVEKLAERIKEEGHESGQSPKEILRLMNRQLDLDLSVWREQGGRWLSRRKDESENANKRGIDEMANVGSPAPLRPRTSAQRLGDLLMRRMDYSMMGFQWELLIVKGYSEKEIAALFGRARGGIANLRFRGRRSLRLRGAVDDKKGGQ